MTNCQISDCKAADEKAYNDKVIQRLKAWYDFEDVPEAMRECADIWAHFQLSDEKYFMAKKINLYSVHNHQWVGVRTYDSVGAAELEKAFACACSYLDAVGPKEDTMSTDYTVALISRAAVDPAVMEMLDRMRYGKSFAWGLKGWADVAVIVVDLQNKTVQANKYGQAQLRTPLWSFDSNPVLPAKKSLLSKIPFFRCSCIG